MWKFWRRLRKNDPEIEIRDGKIIQEANKTDPDYLHSIKPSSEDGTTHRKDGSSVPDEKENQEQRPGTYLPAKPVYHPSYLCDEPDGGDLGLFFRYIDSTRYTERTKSDYMADIRIWKEKLAGSFPSSEKIESITRKLSPHRALRMLTTLKNYGKYRNLHGDPRLMIMFATTLKLKRPALPPSQKKELLSTGQLKMYQDLARKLCAEGDRTGIWIGLSLIGIKSSEMKHTRIDGECVAVGPDRFRAPGWLISGMNRIDRNDWERSNNTIRKGFIQYGTKPHTLYMSVLAADSSRSGSRRSEETHAG